MADTRDLKSLGVKILCRFKSGVGHHSYMLKKIKKCPRPQPNNCNSDLAIVLFAYGGCCEKNHLHMRCKKCSYEFNIYDHEIQVKWKTNMKQETIDTMIMPFFLFFVVIIVVLFGIIAIDYSHKEEMAKAGYEQVMENGTVLWKKTGKTKLLNENNN